MEASRQGILISDLRLDIFAKIQALQHMFEIPENVYPIEQWVKTLSYLTGRKRNFPDVRRAKKYIYELLTNSLNLSTENQDYCFGANTGQRINIYCSRVRRNPGTIPFNFEGG